MMHIHEKELNKIAECNLLHDIINSPKLTNFLNIHYSPILHACMNNRKGKAKFKNVRILLEMGCSSTSIMVRLVGKLHPEKYAVIKWHTQAVNITTNIKV